MSDAEDHTAPESPDDMLAAEYVLGTLPLAERLAAERRARDDAAFAARIAAWENRLSPLNDDYPEVRAPNLLPAIEARLFPQSGAQPARRWRFWGSFASGAVAAMLLLALVLGSLPGPQAPALHIAATLQAEGQPLVFAASWNPQDHVLKVSRTAGPAPEAGKDYELWVIGASGVPASLGLMSAPEITTTLPELAPGMVLAVSLEPAGGSPNGKPTTVLVTGTVKTL